MQLTPTSTAFAIISPTLVTEELLERERFLSSHLNDTRMGGEAATDFSSEFQTGMVQAEKVNLLLYNCVE